MKVKIRDKFSKSKLRQFFAQNFYYPYLKNKVRIKTWLKYDRENPASLYPLTIFEVSTKDINKKTIYEKSFFKENKFQPRLDNSNWSERTEKIEDYYFYKSFREHFKKGKNWEETEWFNEARGTYGASSDKEMREIGDKIDKLYASIQKEGFSKQKQSNSALSTKNQIDNHLNEFNEIIVAIDKNGEIILDDGRHRLLIAKLLDIDKISVRILVRHKEWQEVRNQAVNNPEKLTKKQKQHPDIRALLK